MKLKLGLLILLFSAISMMASSLVVKDAYVRATPPMMKNSAAFMMVMNTSDKDISIVSAKSDMAKKVELHTHDNINGMMKMYQVKKVDVKANAHLMFKPGSYHVMFLGLSKPLKVGGSVDFTLILSNGEEIKITAPVKKVMTGMQHGGIYKMQHGKSHKKMDHSKMSKGAKCACGMDAASCPMDHSKMDKMSKMDHSKMSKGAKCACGMDAASCPMDHSKMDKKDSKATKCNCGNACNCQENGEKCTCGTKKAMKNKM